MEQKEKNMSNVLEAEGSDEYLHNRKENTEFFDILPEQRAELAMRMGKKFNSEELEVSGTDLDYIINVVLSMSTAEAKDILRKVVKEHDGDPNFPPHTYQIIRELLEDDTQGATQQNFFDSDLNPELDNPNFAEKPIDNKTESLIADMTPEQKEYACKVEAALCYYHSPYPEVRSVADPVDDPDLPVETFRAYFLGLLWVIISTGVNQFFEPRQPPISISSSLLQLLVYPCGMLLAKLPDWGFTIKGVRYSLNPGPWNYKEQVLVTIMFGISTNLAYVNDQIYVQRLQRFYDNQWAGAGYQFTLILSTQFLGFGLAGLVRHVLVYPVKCIWPATLPILAMNRALLKPEKKENIHGWTVSRYSFFFMSFAFMFLYFWLPDYLFQAFSYFNWMTWIAPNNFALAAITGSVSGLGINPIPTFDWNVISSQVQPLYTPFFANVNNYVGALIAGAIVIPGVYWSNMYFSAYLPINSNQLFTNTGDLYEVTEVLTNGILDEQKYQNYSPPFYSAANLVVYGTFFAMYPAMIVNMILNHGQILWLGMKVMYLAFTDWVVSAWSFVRGRGWSSSEKRSRTIEAYEDVHVRLMSQYKEVPMWWYVVISLAALILGIVCVEVYPTETPVWTIFFGLGIGIVFLIPIGLMSSVTNFVFSLNVLTEFVAGYALPGKGVSLMIVKAFGLNTNLQAMQFVSDQKLGHYAKVPPRATYRAQIIATLIEAIVVLGVANWQINNYHDLCDEHQPQRFSCPNQTVYYAASVIWGVIGPRRVFSGLYPILKWSFLIGTFVPIPFYLAKRWRPKSHFIRSIDPLVIMFGMLSYAPYNLGYYTGGLYVSIAFMYYIRKHYVAWFEKYTYVLSSGLNAGLALSGIIIFFSVQYNPKDLNWWGNLVPFAGVDGGADGTQQALLPIPDQGYFGPSPGTFPF